MDSLPQRRRSKRLKGENPDGTPSNTAHFATQPKVIHPVDEPTRLATLQPSLAVGSSELQTGFTSPQANNRIVAQLLGAAKRPWPAPAVKRAEKRENVYAKLYISAFDVGRVAPSRIFCLLPHVEVPIVMVGDRDGHIGLWDVALAQDVVNPFQTEVFKRGIRKGKYADLSFSLFHPHRRPISGLCMPTQNPLSLFSTSYDGTFRRFDFRKEEFLLLLNNEEQLTSLTTLPGGDTCIVGDSIGNAVIVDTRVKHLPTKISNKNMFSLHDRKIYCLDTHPIDSNLLLSSSLDQSVKLWDLRSTT